MTENPENLRTKPTLVLGGTGKTGRRIVDRLTARGLPVRIGSRSAPTPFDWDDQTTWAPALDDVRAAYISYFPDLAIPGAPDAVRAFAELAMERGVRRLVLLSGRGEEEAQRAERAVQETGADVTVVRCAWFMQNFSEDYLVGPILDGEVVLPAGDELEPFVDADDIADVAVAALTDDRHIGELYELTSPRLLTFPEAVGEIAATTGRQIDYVTVSVEEYAAGAAEHGVPEEFVGFLTYLFSDVLGRNAYLTDGVQRAVGREPRDFRDYVRDTAATGMWAASATNPGR
ncbi:MAG: NAD(P)H-binding protein [Acidimicrobiales bacterium]